MGEGGGKLSNKLQFNRSRNDAFLESAPQQDRNRFTASGTEVERPIVHVHADELVGLGRSRSRPYCRRKSSASAAMFETVMNALLEEPIHFAASPSGPRSLRIALPPSGSGRPVSSCHHWPRSTTNLRVLLAVGQLSFVDNEAGVDPLPSYWPLSTASRIWSNGTPSYVEIPCQTQSQREIGRGQRAGHGNRPFRERRQRHARLRHDHRPVAIPHACAARAEGVNVGQIGVAVQADGRQLQFAGEGAAVERFDVHELMTEFDSRPCRSCRSPGRET